MDGNWFASIFFSCMQCGGAIHVGWGVSATNVTFAHNSAAWYGGAINVEGNGRRRDAVSEAPVANWTQCTFYNNTAEGRYNVWCMFALHFITIQRFASGLRLCSPLSIVPSLKIVNACSVYGQKTTLRFLLAKNVPIYDGDSSLAVDEHFPLRPYSRKNSLDFP